MNKLLKKIKKDSPKNPRGFWATRSNPFVNFGESGYVKESSFFTNEIFFVPDTGGIFAKVLKTSDIQLEDPL